MKGGHSINRHDHVVRIVTKYIRMVGGIAKVKPRGLREHNKNRPDIKADLGTTSLLIDVVILH